MGRFVDRIFCVAVLAAIPATAAPSRGAAPAAGVAAGAGATTAGGAEVRDWRYVLTIHEIARADDEERLAKLVGDNPDRVLLRLADGKTPVHAAAEAGALKSLRVLGKAGADLNVADMTGHTPLTEAIGLHFTTTVKTLVELGANVNAEGTVEQESPLPPLAIALRKGYDDIVKVLLDAKADLNQVASDGTTPLTSAASGGHDTTMKLLLEHGADANVKDRNGSTALLIAVGRGNAGVVKVLLDAKADVNVKDASGSTALSIAVRRGDGETVKALLDAKADPSQVMPDGNVPLTVAAAGNKWEIARMLAEGGAKVNAQDPGGVTALIYAMVAQNEGMAELLLDKGADPKLADRQGRVPLALTRSPAMWKMLVGKGADINIKLGGATPLQTFIGEGNLALVEGWLELKPDPMVADRSGMTAKELARRGAAGAGVGSDRVKIARLVEEYQTAFYTEREGAGQPASK